MTTKTGNLHCLYKTNNIVFARPCDVLNVNFTNDTFHTKLNVKYQLFTPYAHLFIYINFEIL